MRFALGAFVPLFCGLNGQRRPLLQLLSGTVLPFVGRLSVRREVPGRAVWKRPYCLTGTGGGQADLVGVSVCCWRGNLGKREAVG